jgi:Protein of unknown function (DUF1579)
LTHTWQNPALGLEALSRWLGKWHTEGQQLESPLGPAAPFVAVETFEWLDGGRFMVHRLDGKLGLSPAACVEMIGKNAQGELFAQTFYNDGNIKDWRLSEAGESLILNGTWSKGSDETFQLRYTARFEEAGNTIVGKWEQSRDGQAWHAFLEARSTKAQPLPNASVGS